mmetsp:Transcript_7868/g.29461  ORF Transcript_7868/g.29461 Transcript_7868/m.29461 type:complete len:203 (+) Transcript_7868:926-1534(+)
MFPDHAFHDFKRHPRNLQVGVRCGGREHGKHGAPAAPHVPRLRGDDLRNAPHQELPDFGVSGSLHHLHERLHEIVLEAVQLQFLAVREELHRELPQTVHRVHRDVDVGVTPRFDDKLRHDAPHLYPHEPHPRRVQTGDLHQFRQRKHPWAWAGKLAKGNTAERFGEAHHGVAVQGNGGVVKNVQVVGGEGFQNLEPGVDEIA